MKYLIAGLGNMHPEYKGTRHNLGFEVIDLLSERNSSDFKNEYLGDICEIKYKGRRLILLKPSTYVNRSGKAIKYWFDKMKINRSNLLVIVDDLNLEFGQIRIRNKGSDGGHNGLKSVAEHLGDMSYVRMRIGIGRENFSRGQVGHVLGQWSDTELSKLPDVLEQAADAVQSFCFKGISQTMSEYNSQ